MRGRPVKKVEDVPTQDAVQRNRHGGFEARENPFARFVSGDAVRVQIAVQVANQQLATQLLPEECDVGAHDGPQVEKRWRADLRKRVEKLGKDDGGTHLVGWRRRRRLFNRGLFSRAPTEQVCQAP